MNTKDYNYTGSVNEILSINKNIESYGIKTYITKCYGYDIIDNRYNITIKQLGNKDYSFVEKIINRIRNKGII